MSQDAEDLMKEAVKKAAKEWMNEKLQEFGWFSIKTLVCLFIGGVVYLAMLAAGWHK